MKVAQLDPSERLWLLIDGPNGLEPAMFWLTEMDPDDEIRLEATVPHREPALPQPRRPHLGHPHSLRHTFAVVTLEQLQRGHIASQADRNPEQRRTYSLIFGDPLDWVRRRLGHRSVVTTQIYLHALAELEMGTPHDARPRRLGRPPRHLDQPIRR